MSTKIYDGFVIRTPIAKLMPVLKEYKQSLQPKVDTIALNRMHEILLEAAIALKSGRVPEAVAVSFLPSTVRSDQYDSWTKRLVKDPRWWSHWLVQRIAMEQAGPSTRVADQDLDADVRLWLWLIPRNGSTYGIPCGNRDLVSGFLQLPGVEEYGYWNNTDRPEGMTAAQWRARSRTWDALLPDYYIDDDAFRFDMFDPVRFQFPVPSGDSISEWLAAGRERLVRSRAREILLDRYDRKEPKDEDETPMDRFFFLDRLARTAMKESSEDAADAFRQAEADVPENWDGLRDMFPKYEEENQ